MQMKLICTDIDGTLLDTSGHLPNENRATLYNAVRMGTQVLLASVRRRATIEEVIDQLELPCTVICAGGALLYTSDGRLLHYAYLDSEICQALAHLAETHRIPLVLTVKDVNYTCFDTPNTTYVRAESYTNLLSHGPVTRAIVSDPTAVDRCVNLLRGAPVTIKRLYSNTGVLQGAIITHTTASKVAMLRYYCHTQSINLSSVIALGDGETDIEMITLAGIGVAMGNAPPTVRASADWVAPHTNEYGFAQAIQRFLPLT